LGADHFDFAIGGSGLMTAPHRARHETFAGKKDALCFRLIRG
jgi:hypothetical protein